MINHMQKRYFCFECGTNVLEEKMENRIAGWFGVCKRCNKNNIYSVWLNQAKSLICCSTIGLYSLIASLSPRWPNNYIIFSLLLFWWSVYRRIIFFHLLIWLFQWIFGSTMWVMFLSYKNSLDALITLLSLGGKITQASNHLSLMLNGLKYYSLEVTINGDHYLIQAFEQEASDLFDAVMAIIDEKKTAITKIEKIFRKSILLDLNFS